MRNPYFHDEYKPHLIDRKEIRILCFEIYNIIESSMNFGSNNIEPNENFERKISRIEQICFEISEFEMSNRLLKLALLIRTFDDTMIRSANAQQYKQHKLSIEQENNSIFGIVFEGNDNLIKTIRDCSNKIIHANDIRPVYYTQNDRHDINATWGMDGTIELEGKQGTEIWSIMINLYYYLEGVLGIIEFFDE